VKLKVKWRDLEVERSGSGYEMQEEASN
jgi:hypothetical protein